MTGTTCIIKNSIICNIDLGFCSWWDQAVHEIFHIVLIDFVEAVFV